MLFKGKKPIMILHQKLGRELKCVCGAELKYKDGEFVHPSVKLDDDIKRLKEHYGL